MSCEHEALRSLVGCWPPRDARGHCYVSTSRQWTPFAPRCTALRPGQRGPSSSSQVENAALFGSLACLLLSPHLSADSLLLILTLIVRMMGRLCIDRRWTISDTTSFVFIPSDVGSGEGQHKPPAALTASHKIDAICVRLPSSRCRQSIRRVWFAWWASLTAARPVTRRCDGDASAATLLAPDSRAALPHRRHLARQGPSNPRCDAAACTAASSTPAAVLRQYLYLVE